MTWVQGSPYASYDSKLLGVFSYSGGKRYANPVRRIGGLGIAASGRVERRNPRVLGIAQP